MLRIKTRKELIAKIAEEAFCENLGLFVGTGFSMAMDERTCDFKGLVASIYEDNYESNFEDALKKKYLGMSYPQIVEDIEKKKSGTIGKKRIRKRIESIVVKKCSINLDEIIEGGENKKRKEEMDLVKGALNEIKPQWVITTNYDLVLEQLIDNYETIGPNNPFSMHRRTIPIFHLHGHVNNPENIVISEKDYVKLLNPIEYRQIKLSSILAESSVIFLGYSLNDVNVRSALEQAKLYSLSSCDSEKGNPKLRVLFYYDKTAEDDKDDVIKQEEDLFILKARDVKKFLTDIKNEFLEYKKSFEQLIKEILNSTPGKIDFSLKIKNLKKDVQNRVSDKLIKSLDDFRFVVKENNREFTLEFEQITNMFLNLLEKDIILDLKPMLIHKMALLLNLFGQLQATYPSISKKWSANTFRITSKVEKRFRHLAMTNGYRGLEKILNKNIECIDESQANPFNDYAQILAWGE